MDCKNCRHLVSMIPAPDLMPAVLASLTARSFPRAPAWQGQRIHSSLSSRRLNMSVCQLGQHTPDSSSVRMMAMCNRCVSLLEASHCIACLTASTDMVKQVCLLVGCLTSQQRANVSQGRICSDKFTCCHTEIEVADQLSTSPSHSIPTPGRPVPALTL